MKMRDAILKVVSQKSGGCKIIELQTEIMNMAFLQEIDDLSKEQIFAMKDFAQFLEEEVKRIGELRTLDYLYPECNRIKTFVYFPL